MPKFGESVQNSTHTFKNERPQSTKMARGRDVGRHPEPDRPPPSNLARRPFFWNGRGAMYGFHFTGVTAKGVPFAELTQPAAVSLLGSFSW
jgi:hypothetical protein